MTPVTCPHCGYTHQAAIVYEHIVYRCDACDKRFTARWQGETVQTRPAQAQKERKLI